MTEVIGSDNPQQTIAKLDKVLCHRQSVGRILIGKYWNDIEKVEQRPCDVWSGSISAIEPGVSSTVRELQERGTVLGDIQMPTPAEISDRKPTFIKMANHFSSYLGAEEPDVQRALQLEASRGHAVANRTSDIRGPSPAFRRAAVMEYLKYRKAAWTRVFDDLPERCASARWMRLLAWYCIKRAESPDAAIASWENDYDDIHYAFLSLYTRHLWTTDKGMRDATLAVSHGGVKVHTSWDTIPTYR